MHWLQCTALSTVHCTVCSTLHCLQYTALSAVHCPVYSTLHCLQYTALSTVHCTVSSALHCLQYTVLHCTVKCIIHKLQMHFLDLGNLSLCAMSNAEQCNLQDWSQIARYTTQCTVLLLNTLYFILYAVYSIQ